MMDYRTIPTDTETACGREFADWPVSYRTMWTYDLDHGAEVECRFYRAHIGNLEINRATAIAIFGEQGVRTMENDATTYLAERMPEHLEAAE